MSHPGAVGSRSVGAPAVVKALIAAKVLLAALLLTGTLFPQVGGFEGKGFGYRLPIFLLPSLIEPARWWRSGTWGIGVDTALTVPFLLDTLGNAVGFYDRFAVTDDVLHFANWIVLVWGITATLLTDRIDQRRLVWLAGFGFGGVAIIGWEAAEYLVMKAGVGGLNLTYGDTIGDLLLSTSGGGLGAAIAVAWPVAVRLRWGRAQ